MLKPCIEPDCPTVTNKTRCRAHERTRDRARGTKAQRGYGADFDRSRRDFTRRERAGERFDCWRCGTPLEPGAWDLGHADDDRAVIRGPECRSCNRATSGR